jgi:hypothetical protein
MCHVIVLSPKIEGMGLTQGRLYHVLLRLWL